MHLKGSGSVRRIGVFTAGLTIMLLLWIAAGLSLAGLENVQAHPLKQDPTTYPIEIPTQSDPYPYPYPVETDWDFGATPTREDLPTNSFQPTQVFFTPQPQQTITLLPNAFLTENAEMGGGQVTPLGPTLTPSETPTVTPTRGADTPQPTPFMLDGGSGGSGGLNWGLFWMGFSLPLLGACGWVLYMLDRRPDLFRSRG